MSLPNCFLLALAFTSFAVSPGCLTANQPSNNTQLHPRVPPVTWDHCDVDINPLGVSKDETRNLTVEYTGTATGMIVQFMYVHPGTSYLYGRDGATKIGELVTGKPFSVVLSWANPSADRTVHVTGPTMDQPFASDGTYSAGERRTSPAFEEQDDANNEYVRVRVRFRGLSTFFVIKP